MLAPVTHILPLTQIRRERVLPTAGKVVVRQGQKVGPNDVVAEANLAPDYLLLDLARGLRLSPEKTDRYIRVKADNLVSEGEVLAGPVGLFKRVIRSPKDGRVVLAGSGQILLEITSKPFQLRAGIPGEVVELIGDLGVTIETNGGLVQGVWGNGRIEFGVLTVVAKSPEHVIEPKDLDVSMRGSIILAGSCQSEIVLRSAEEMPLRGLIFSSASGVLRPVMEKLSLPVILLEGFGQRPYNSVAYKLLSTADRREVAINAAPWNRNANIRPEIILPASTTGTAIASIESAHFALDQLVRIRRGPHASATGTIVNIKNQFVFPGGLRAQAAEVHLGDETKAVIPLANLEVIA